MSELKNHYAISDLHLGHANVLRHDNRPFDSIKAHDEHLTNACKSLGKSNQTLWILGDVASRPKQLVKFMDAIKPQWGKVILIRGNHDDRVAWKMRDLFDEAHESRYVRADKNHKFYLSHYAHRVWRNSHHGAYHLHGHSHGALPRLGRSMDVGANCINYMPICFEECAKQLDKESSTNHH